jgi:beta-glucosidase
MDTTRLLWFDDPFRPRQPPAFSARVRTTFTADRAGEWTIGFTSVGDGRLIIDGELVLDNGDVPLAAIAAMGKPELTTTIELAVGEQIELEFQLRRISDADGLTALLIGCRPPTAADPIAEAVTLAQSADVTVLVVGTSGEYETEGRDRDDIALPGDQNALIEAVSAVSSRTVVVLNIGAPVAMPWLDRVDAVLVSWFAGQELGDALVDVLTGVVEPQGRLPMTFPRQLADSPAFEHHPGRDGVAEYAEGRLIGHRWYDLHDIEPLFGFGFGLGYATTDIVGATLVDPWSVEVVIQNRSDRDGVAVAQVYAYLADRDGMAADEPPQRLVGFAKVDVAARSSRVVVVELDPRAYQGWDTDLQGWSDHGRAVELRIGHSSRDVAVTLAVPADRIPNRP